METTVPRGFWAVAILLLLWNIIGDTAYLMQVTANLDELARTDAYTARAFAEMPKWAWSAYAIGVWSGTAAAIALLLRRRLAVWLFMLSLVAVVAQFGRVFMFTDLIAVKGPTAAIFPIVIFAIGAFAVHYSRRGSREGWLR